MVTDLKKKLDNLNFPVVITDQRGVICYANHSQSDLSGFSFAEMIGRRPGDLWGGNMPTKFYIDLWETIKRGDVFKKSVINMNKLGGFYTDQITISSVKNNGRPEYFIQSNKLIDLHLDQTNLSDLEKEVKDSFSDRLEDAVLIERAKVNSDNFAHIYRKYYQSLVSHILLRVRYDFTVAEDIAQETFSRAFKYINNYNSVNSTYFTYLVKIAHSVLIKHLKETNGLIPLDENMPINYRSKLYTDIDLNFILSYASHKESSVLKSYYLDGYSVHEIAVLLGKSENAVKLILSRARKNLKLKLVSQGVD